MRPSSVGVLHRVHRARQYTRPVPIYEYACMECESHFDELVRSADQAVTCPECGAAKVLKQLSTLRRARRGVEAGVQRPVGRRRRMLRRLVRLRPLTSQSGGEDHPVRPYTGLPWRTPSSAQQRSGSTRSRRRGARVRPRRGRTQVVFGSGSPDADLMFVGEAPGFHEDQQGVPFVGQAGKLLDKLLAGIGLTRADVFVANVLKCRPPGNRDPLPDEIAACEPHLFRQIELIEPKLVATLGNFATKLLSGKPAGITRVHGYEQEVTLGSRTVLLYPIYHPAAALYTPSMLKVLEEDFARIPDLLERAVGDAAARRASRRLRPSSPSPSRSSSACSDARRGVRARQLRRSAARRRGSPRARGAASSRATS